LIGARRGQDYFRAHSKNRGHVTADVSQLVYHIEQKALQKVCRQRQAVIDELKQACDDRLSLINQLSASSRKVNARPFPDSFRAADADQNDAQRPVASNEAVAD
jgi:hypothetical protein